MTINISRPAFCAAASIICCLVALSGLGALSNGTANIVPPLKATLTSLLVDHEKLHSKRVEVFGYYRSAPEESALYEDRQAAQNAAKGIWISFRVKEGFQSQVRAVGAGPVRIIGTFEYKPSGVGHLGRWKGQLTDLELMEPIEPESQGKVSEATRKSKPEDVRKNEH